MADNSKIEWTDASWNPIRARKPPGDNENLMAGHKIGWHCTHASEACRYCYAEVLNRRFGTGLDYKPGHEKDIEIFLDEKMLLQPLRWKRPRKIFVGSMTDLFADFVKDEWLDRIFAVMALRRQHTFQVLTKRPERMREYLCNPNIVGQIKSAIWSLDHEACLRWEDGKRSLGYVSLEETLGWKLRTGVPCRETCRRPFPCLEHPEGGQCYGKSFNDGPLKFPLPNVWLGTSCENQATADERIPHLLATPAAIRFLSCEPLLGPIDLCNLPSVSGIGRHLDALMNDAVFAGSDLKGGIGWVICGGESGPHARPMHPDWSRSLRDQCAAAGVAFHFKQWGESIPKGQTFGDGFIARNDDPEQMFWRVGKKNAGRLLDGVEHNGFPEVR